MTIAEKMLELLDEGWGKGLLRAYQTREKVAFRCAVGIRLDAAGMTSVLNEAAASVALRDDPVIAAMARIIREQYAEALRDYTLRQPSCFNISEILASDINVILTFNDRYATLADIRAVIEKVIAEGL